MHAVCCVKSVVLAAPSGKTVRTAQNTGLNPFDRPALALAARLARAAGGRVTALSMGPDCATAALFEALALGADEAVLLCDPALAGADTLATSRALAGALAALAPVDLVLFGARTSDSDTGQVGPQCATLLGLPLVCHAREAEPAEDGGLTVVREADGFIEEYALELPAALTVHPDAEGPGDLALGVIEDVFAHGRIRRLTAVEAGLAPETAGLAGSPTVVVDMARVKRARSCELIGGTPAEQAEALVEALAARGLLD